MKIKFLIVLTVLVISSCNNSNKKQSKMEVKPTIIEMVLFKTNKGVNQETTKKAMTELNDFLSNQKGFVSRKTSVSEDGQYLDLVFWTDLSSAKSASEKAMQNPKAMEAFSVINQKQMTFKHFEVFNEK